MTTAIADIPVRERDLATIVQAYSEVTEKLKRSHDILAREVCRLREEIAQKNLELARKERLAALGELAAGVAHEIRNPLAGIQLYASVLDRDLEDRPAEREVVRRVAWGVRHIESIVRDILAFARGAQPNLRAVQIGELVADTVAQAALAATARGMRVEVDGGLAAGFVHCDPGQIQRVMLNLVLNAIDATDDGGVVRVRDAGVSRDGSLRVIAVEDDGPGIPEDQLDRIFNPFFTTKDQGTGLGLAIAHRIVESHEGRLTACNRPEGGAVFTLALPVDVEDSETPGEESWITDDISEESPERTSAAGLRN
jgi:signal transduction histidine kinase